MYFFMGLSMNVAGRRVCKVLTRQGSTLRGSNNNTLLQRVAEYLMENYDYVSLQVFRGCLPMTL